MPSLINLSFVCLFVFPFRSKNEQTTTTTTNPITADKDSGGTGPTNPASSQPLFLFCCHFRGSPSNKLGLSLDPNQTWTSTKSHSKSSLHLLRQREKHAYTIAPVYWNTTFIYPSQMRSTHILYSENHLDISLQKIEAIICMWLLKLQLIKIKRNLKASCSVALAKFPVFNSHVWLVAATLFGLNTPHHHRTFYWLTLDWSPLVHIQHMEHGILNLCFQSYYLNLHFSLRYLNTHFSYWILGVI